ncbi:MAG: hypothetical protein J2P54_19990, partial [Bradyrhizobiaceae bacterium]|nr:hypothetical protein [Bradyrhizobiaceae bacterium]
MIPQSSCPDEHACGAQHEKDADVAAPTLETLHKRHRNRTIFDYLLSGRDRSAARGTWEPTTMIPITNRRRKSFNVIAFPLGDP